MEDLDSFLPELDDAERFDETSFLKAQVENIPSRLLKISISQHAEENRVLPSGSPRPGPLDLDYTPWIREIMDNMSPTSIIQETSVLKGAQLGLTMSAECVVCYYIGEDPSDQLFISASSDSIEKWASRRLEPAISSYGYRPIIQSAENRSGKRMGDKMFSKEYFGRRLDMASAQSAASMRSSDKRILIRDEIDGAPAKLKTGEGNWLDVSYARTNAWGNRKKIFDLSTPTNYETSLIWKQYLKGDRRNFFVPCPCCEKMQTLKMENLIDDKEAGRIVNAFYACEHCGEAIYEYHKKTMFHPSKCEWKPTAVSTSKYIRSYYINSLYSPIGMLSWTKIAQLRDEANKSSDPEDKKAFKNLYEGMPYKQEGQKPKLEKVIELKGIYEAQEVPDMVLFITIGLDVQRGSTKNKENPARLELEVLGHGPGYRTFSIDYLRFEGAVNDAFSGAWENLHEWAMSNELSFSKKDGTKIPVSMTFMDSGDGELTSVVYQFTQRWNSTFPIKGYQSLSKNKGIDKASVNDFKRYKRSKIGEDTILYNISTNYYKTTIYNNLKIKRIESDIQAPGYCDFPISYKKKYFEGLTAEEKREDGNFYCPDKKRNEPLDCRCYALCAADVYLELLVEKYRDAARKRGAKEINIKTINRRWVIDVMKKQMNVSD